MAEHTKGPWSWRWTSDHVQVGTNAHGRRIETHIAADSEMVFEGDEPLNGMFYLSGPPGSNGSKHFPDLPEFVLTCEDEIKPANARLIAAAPELLEALIHCRTRLFDDLALARRDDAAITIDILAALVKKADTAIAKARGH